MVETTWAQWQARLVDELATLQDREFVILGEEPPEPAPEPEPPRGVLARLRGLLRHRPDSPPTRYVQFLRIEDTITAECVGATSFGGYVDIAPDDHERLRTLGWNAPGDTSEVEWGALNYRLYTGVDESDRLALLAVDSLQVLGLSPHALVLTRDR